jgi:hypothetical protein
MIRYIIDEINDKLNYSFRDTLRGIAYPVLNKTVLIPGDRNGMVYEDCVPDDKKKSIVYWEDYGSITVLNTPRYQRITSNVRLIVWMNFRLIDKEVSGEYDECVKEILNCIPKRMKDVFITHVGQQPKTPAIFSRYNYRDGKQYVSPPFDVAAFDFKITYMSTYCPIITKNEEI